MCPRGSPAWRAVSWKLVRWRRTTCRVAGCVLQLRARSLSPLVWYRFEDKDCREPEGTRCAWEAAAGAAGLATGVLLMTVLSTAAAAAASASDASAGRPTGAAARAARSTSADASGVSSARGVASTFAAPSVRRAASRCSSAAVQWSAGSGNPAVEKRGDPHAEPGGDRGQGAGAGRVAPQDRADRIRLQRGPRRQLALRPASTLKVRADPGRPWLLVRRILRHPRVAGGRRGFGAGRRGVLDRQQPYVRRLVTPGRRDHIADLHRPAVQRRPFPTDRRPAVLVGYLGTEDEDVRPHAPRPR